MNKDAFSDSVNNCARRCRNNSDEMITAVYFNRLVGALGITDKTLIASNYQSVDRSINMAT